MRQERDTRRFAIPVPVSARLSIRSINQRLPVFTEQIGSAPANCGNPDDLLPAYAGEITDGAKTSPLQRCSLHTKVKHADREIIHQFRLPDATPVVRARGICRLSGFSNVHGASLSGGPSPVHLPPRPEATHPSGPTQNRLDFPGIR